VEAVNADLNRLGMVVGDTVDVFGATHDRLRSNETGIRERPKSCSVRNTTPFPRKANRERGLVGFGWEARRDEPGREGTHRKHCGAWLEKDAAERISSTRGKYEPGKKEPRVGGSRGSGRQKGARGD
jgi:hypothetical protein